jgi:ABC-type bacteriocin/lantibiotic exporter with double-glycine peptidase domain
VSLFEKSILENLTYGYYDVDDTVNRIKILISKYKLGQIFVNINKDMELKTDMVDEYGFLNYNVGKHGNMLSGGQRQIIHIIRAVLNKSSKIMILDEPTTALDNISRDNVIRMIKENCGMKTVLIITHDEAIKKMCNSVIKFG